MESVRKVRRKRKGKESRLGSRYGFELKLRCVKLRLEEGLPVRKKIVEIKKREPFLGVQADFPEPPQPNSF